jgi:transposase
MMGPRQLDQAALFYEFSLERHVPATHLLRSIDRFVDLSDVRSHLAPFYSFTGRPSIDPELLVRMLLVGYCYGIRSERRLCEEVHLNLAYRWFCRLGLDGDDGATLLYRASKHDCDACELKPRCCPKMPVRKVPRSIYENARDVARHRQDRDLRDVAA